MIQALLARAAIKRALGIAKVALPLLLLAAVGIYIMNLRTELRSLSKQRDTLLVWQGEVVATVRSEVPVDRRDHLDETAVVDEIHWLGREYRTATAALDSQSAKVRAAQAKAVEAQSRVRTALDKAHSAEAATARVRQGLNDPTRTTGLTGDEWGAL